MKSLSLLIATFAGICMSAPAQNVSFPAYELQRGYYDAPYLRYEAEPGFCTEFKGEMLLPPVPYSQVPLQAEASRQACLTLCNDGDFVEWTASAEGDGITLRFSMPDSDDGTGLTGKLAFYAGEEKLTDIAISSYWAWQYTDIANSSEKYPDNTPGDQKFPRMRFDEVCVLLPRPIAKGERFRIVKEDGSEIPYTVDFVEVEKVPAPISFDEIEGEKVMYDGSVALAALINRSAGKTVYLPAGTHNIDRRIIITASNVKIKGAGMWHTTLYFSASPDNGSTYSQRGFESYANGITLEDFSMNTANNRRYYQNNPSYQTGKGIQGSFGSGSLIRNIRIDHFECGAWMGDYGGTASRNLEVRHCRFRNNYADGFNFCSGSTSGTVSHCSFRNNGDDDMAVWSTGNIASGNTFEYDTAELNWRASSCAFYGGSDNSARNLYIADGLEEGLHINGEFDGTGFSGVTTVERVTIERCGDEGGIPGQHGGFWGTACPALHIRGGYFLSLNNVSISNIEIFNSRYNAIGISSNNRKEINNLQLDNIHIDGVGDSDRAIYVDASAIGYGSYRDLQVENAPQPAVVNASNRFTFTDLGNSGIDAIENRDLLQNPRQATYDLHGRHSNGGTRREILIDSSGKKYIGRNHERMSAKD